MFIHYNLLDSITSHTFLENLQKYHNKNTTLKIIVILLTDSHFFGIMNSTDNRYIPSWSNYKSFKFCRSPNLTHFALAHDHRQIICTNDVNNDRFNGVLHPNHVKALCSRIPAWSVHLYVKRNRLNSCLGFHRVSLETSTRIHALTGLTRKSRTRFIDLTRPARSQFPVTDISKAFPLLASCVRLTRQMWTVTRDLADSWSSTFSRCVSVYVCACLSVCVWECGLPADDKGTLGSVEIAVRRYREQGNRVLSP